MSVKIGLRFCSKIAACGLLLCSLLPVSVQAQTLGWKQQLGTSSFDELQGVATDSFGDVYITGSTPGSLAGPNNAGSDAWVAKYDRDSLLLWKQQLGLFGPDVISNAVATDSKGNVYISGETSGSLAASNQGRTDAWVAKYNTSGALLWKRQLGTSGADGSSGVATDSLGNVYISGYTSGSLGGANKGEGIDAWVAKYNSSGEPVWKRQLGTFETDYSNGVATDSQGNVYISGYTDSNLAGTYHGEGDAWVAKYNTSGTRLWDRQFGSARFDISNGVATDSKGNVYISGDTKGSLAGVYQGGTNGSGDAWVAKYDSSGALVWDRQLGTTAGDRSFGVATDSTGNVYISGLTLGSLGGGNQGGNDAFVAKYSTTGGLVWKQQLGTSSFDYSSGVAVNYYGDVYVSGSTRGSLGGANQGFSDGFVVQYRQ